MGVSSVATSVETKSSRKRRLSTAGEQEDFSVARSLTAPLQKRRERPTTTPREQAAPPRARAKAQSPRRPLSGEEKRENHNESEQRRRREAKQRWRELIEVVPPLGRGFSQTGEVLYALSWLQQADAEIERMKDHLQAISALGSEVN